MSLTSGARLEERRSTPQRIRSRRAPNPWLAAPLTVAASAMAAMLPATRIVLGNDALMQLLVLDALLLVAFALGYVRRPPLQRVWLIGMVLIPLGAALSGRSSSLRASVLVGVALAIMCALLPAVLSRLFTDRPRAPRTIIAAFLIGQSISSASAMLQGVGIDVGGAAVFGRATGLAGHPNTLGIMAALALLASLGAWRHATAGVRTVLAGVIVLNGAALVATGSLSTMLALAVAATYGAIAARRAVVASITSVLALGILFIGSQLSTDAASPFASIARRIDVVTGASDGSGGAASIGVRESTYEWAWRWIADSPIVGVGMDNMRAGTFDGVTVVHSFILRGWYQGGLALALWLALLTAVLVLGVVIPAARRGVGVWEAAAILLILVFAATSAFYTQLEYWLPLVTVIVLGGRAVEASKDSGSRAEASVQ